MPSTYELKFLFSVHGIGGLIQTTGPSLPLPPVIHSSSSPLWTTVFLGVNPMHTTNTVCFVSPCRCGGLGLVLASAGFGMLTAPIIELHNQKGYFLHHIIFACCTLICIICILLLPESRDQNLPENISNGEHYTRQPLLPHKKGEQPLLLTNAELKDYSGLHDVATAGDGLPEGATANGMKSM